jgi:hypothetical protein
MNRRLLNVLTILLLLLSVAVVALWVRSYGYMNTVLLRPVAPEPGGSGPVSQASLGFRSGVVYFGRQRWTEPPRPWGPKRQLERGVFVSSSAGGGAWDAGFNPGTVRWHVGRFARVEEVAGGNHVRFLTIPAWPLAALFAALPALHLYRRTRRRHLPGQCPSCGYNLTGNVSGVCPECGTATSARSAA